MTDKKYLDINKILNISQPGMLLTKEKVGDLRSNPENKSRFLQVLNVKEEDFYLAQQSHSRVVAVEPRPGQQSSCECDGFISNNGVLAVTVADCMPIFLFNNKHEVYSVLHSGWEGTGIINEALDLFESIYSITSSEVSVVLGPSIRNCCYEVGQDRADLFASLWGQSTVVSREGRVYLDLPEANRKLAEKRGVKELLSIPVCTCCTSDLGSYRRQGKDFTRMTAAVGNF